MLISPFQHLSTFKQLARAFIVFLFVSILFLIAAYAIYQLLIREQDRGKMLQVQLQQAKQHALTHQRKTAVLLQNDALHLQKHLSDTENSKQLQVLLFEKLTNDALHHARKNRIDVVALNTQQEEFHFQVKGDYAASKAWVSALSSRHQANYLRLKNLTFTTNIASSESLSLDIKQSDTVPPSPVHMVKPVGTLMGIVVFELISPTLSIN
jgi:competence protein ComGC